MQLTNLTPQQLYDEMSKLLDVKSYMLYKNCYTTPFGSKVEVFCYRIDGLPWDKIPLLRQFRGIMFEMDKEHDGKVVRIMSRPFEKFFNWGQNELSTFPISKDTTEWVMVKLDGMLMSTYYDINPETKEPEIFLKSKTTPFSDYALLATSLLKQDERYNDSLAPVLLKLALAGLTVNMEYIGPRSHIVVIYPTQQLSVLDVRCNLTGKSYNKDLDQLLEIVDDLSIQELNVLKSNFVNFMELPDEIPESNNTIEATSEFIQNYKKSSTGSEGFVLCDKHHGLVKVKTDWYVERHEVRFSLNSSKSIFESIHNRTIDDVLVLYKNDKPFIDLINSHTYVYYKHVSEAYNIFEAIYTSLSGLDRKSYAIKASALLEKIELRYRKFIFGILMWAFQNSSMPYPDLQDKVIDDIEAAICRQYKDFMPEVDN